MTRVGHHHMVKVMRLPTLAVLACLSVVPAAHAQPSAENAHAALQPDSRAVPPVEAEELVFGEEIGFYDPSGSAMRPFHDALRGIATEDRQVRVMFYGASHVASDLFTHVVRERLQTRFGDAGHGFLMPARPWRHYRHLGGLRVESNRRWEALRIRANTRGITPLGPAGMAVESDSRSSWGRIDTGTASANRFVVYYLQQPDGGSFDVRVDGRRVTRIATRADAFGAGVEVIQNLEDVHHVLEVQPRGDGVVRLFGVSVERERPGVIVDTMGLNGARAVSHLHWDESLHREYLTRMSPDLIVLAYGTNESGDDDHPIERYEVELRRVVGRVRGTVPNAACMLVGPSDRPMRGEEDAYVDRPRTHQVIEVQRRVSRDLGCAFFDLVEFGGGPLSMIRWAATEPRYAQRDLIHFTGRAYRRLGEVLHTAMLGGYDPPTEAEPSTDTLVPE